MSDATKPGEMSNEELAERFEGYNEVRKTSPTKAERRGWWKEMMKVAAEMQTRG